ncbi:hypothetical protein LINGRAHAP2_LOCUS31399 [Linum grandiflorum]
MEKCPERQAEIDARGDGLPSGFFKLSILAGFNSPESSPPRPIPMRSSSSSLGCPPRFEHLVVRPNPRGGRALSNGFQGSPSTPTSAYIPTRGYINPSHPPTDRFTEWKTSDIFPEGIAVSGRRLPIQPRDLSFEMENLEVNPTPQRREVGAQDGLQTNQAQLPNGPVLDLNLSLSYAHKKRKALSPGKFFSYPTKQSPLQITGKGNKLKQKSLTQAKAKLKNKNREKSAEEGSMSEKDDQGEMNQEATGTAACLELPRLP